MGFERIIFATDFSPISAEAERQTIELAARLGARVRVVHAIEPVNHLQDERSFASFYVKERQRAECLLQAAVERFQAAGVTAEGAIVSGVCWAAIIHSAVEQQADLIVIGTHGYKTNDLTCFPGSTSIRLPFLAPCPVLVVAHRG